MHQGRPSLPFPLRLETPPTGGVHLQPLPTPPRGRGNPPSPLHLRLIVTSGVTCLGSLSRGPESGSCPGGDCLPIAAGPGRAKRSRVKGDPSGVRVPRGPPPTRGTLNWFLKSPPSQGSNARSDPASAPLAADCTRGWRMRLNSGLVSASWLLCQRSALSRVPSTQLLASLPVPSSTAHPAALHGHGREGGSRIRSPACHGVSKPTLLTCLSCSLGGAKQTTHLKPNRNLKALGVSFPLRFCFLGWIKLLPIQPDRVAWCVDCCFPREKSSSRGGVGLFRVNMFPRRMQN